MNQRSGSDVYSLVRMMSLSKNWYLLCFRSNRLNTSSNHTKTSQANFIDQDHLLTFVLTIQLLSNPFMQIEPALKRRLKMMFIETDENSTKVDSKGRARII